MLTVLNHLLYIWDQQVTFIRSPNQMGRLMKPTLIVIHYTGSNSEQGAISWLCSPQAKVSAHLVIGKHGSITQLVPFNVVAWHAGVSDYNGQSGVNGFSIGIENVGVGDEWPEAQIEANKAVIQALAAAYPIENIVGHSEVASGRKVDPGPHYPWHKVTQEV